MNTITMVSCELCGIPTRMTGTKRCDGCYELESRIKGNPFLARQILYNMTAATAQDEVYWRTKDGRQIAVGDIPIDHLRNILRMIIRAKQRRDRLLAELDANADKWEDDFWADELRYGSS